MRLFPNPANASHQLWVAYMLLAANLAIGVFWLVFVHRPRLYGLAWLAIAAAWAWESEAKRRSLARERHGPGHSRQP